MGAGSGYCDRVTVVHSGGQEKWYWDEDRRGYGSIGGCIAMERSGYPRRRFYIAWSGYNWRYSKRCFFLFYLFVTL